MEEVVDSVGEEEAFEAGGNGKFGVGSQLGYGVMVWAHSKNCTIDWKASGRIHRRVIVAEDGIVMDFEDSSNGHMGDKSIQISIKPLQAPRSG